LHLPCFIKSAAFAAHNFIFLMNSDEEDSEEPTEDFLVEAAKTDVRRRLYEVSISFRKNFKKKSF
jgi:hypothetical protein